MRNSKKIFQGIPSIPQNNVMDLNNVRDVVIVIFLFIITNVCNFYVSRYMEVKKDTRDELGRLFWLATK